MFDVEDGRDGGVGFGVESWSESCRRDDEWNHLDGNETHGTEGDPEDLATSGSGPRLGVGGLYRVSRGTGGGVDVQTRTVRGRERVV